MKVEVKSCLLWRKNGLSKACSKACSKVCSRACSRMQQGMQQEAREMLIEVISSRFGVVPEDVARRINGIEQKEVLRMLMRKAVSSESLESFNAFLIAST